MQYRKVVKSFAQHGKIDQGERATAQERIEDLDKKAKEQEEKWKRNEDEFKE
jgi:hypothetical protein